MLTLVLAACLVAAAAGYLIGRSTGADLDAASSEGASEGLAIARDAADRRGYTEGRRDGERSAFRSTYRKSYRAAYRRKRRKLQEEATAAQQPVEAGSTSGPPPGSEYTDELPNGRPGYVLPEDQRSFGCVGIDAATGECVGD